MTKHKKGELNKRYYAPNGELYADALFYGKRNDRQYKNDMKKQEKAEQKAKYKLSQKMKEAQQKRDNVPEKERIEQARKNTKDLKKKLGIK